MDYDFLNQKLAGALIKVNIHVSQWNGYNTDWFEPLDTVYLILEVLNEIEFSQLKFPKSYSPYSSIGEPRVCLLVSANGNTCGLAVYLKQIVFL